MTSSIRGLRLEKTISSICCWMLIAVVSTALAQELMPCCVKATGSCRSLCEDFSVVKYTSGLLDREDLLTNLTRYCPLALNQFWECMNETLEAVYSGSSWWGRECCSSARRPGCRWACATAGNSSGLLRSCRRSDEHAFFECVDRREEANECCSNTQSMKCRETCWEVFRSSGDPQALKRKLKLACEPHSSELIKCLNRRTRTNDAIQAERYLPCCRESTDESCREACERVLVSKRTTLEITNGLQDGGCGLPTPHHPMWQCFLRMDKKTEPETDVAVINRLGIDATKLHCCQKASSPYCNNLCYNTYSTDWIINWKRFDSECLKQTQEYRLARCVEEVEEQCELGCDGLSYCTNFNGRSSELFRSCDVTADVGAHHHVVEWQRQGMITLAGVQFPIRNTTQCPLSVWKAIACTLHVKPCVGAIQSSRICVSSCERLVSRCVPDAAYSTAKALCSSLGDGDDEDCVSLEGYLFSGCCTDLLVKQLISINCEESFDTLGISKREIKVFTLSHNDKHKIVNAFESGKSRNEIQNESELYTSHNKVSSPCKSNPCNTSQVCEINRNCRTGELSCATYKCVPGCNMGDASQHVVPVGTFVRVPMRTTLRSCHKICECSASGRIDSCRPMPCVSYDNCSMLNKRVLHGDIFYMECNLCVCAGGERICSGRACGAARPLTRLPCNCPVTYSPVCAGGRTFPSICLARCYGLMDSDIVFGACLRASTCAGAVACSAGEACFPRPTLCLSRLQTPCLQYTCVNLTNCALQEYEPVCDTTGRTHRNPCQLLTSGRDLAYRGNCIRGCDHLQQVCGINGQTYQSECEAFADFSVVDYFGKCKAVGPISDEMSAKCQREQVTCPELKRQKCTGFTAPGACCPKCGGAIRILYSKKQLDRVVYRMSEDSIPILNLNKLMTSLERHVKILECVARGHLTLENEIFVSVVSILKNPSDIQLKSCVLEAERLASLINTQTARFLSELTLSPLIHALEIHTSPSRSDRPLLNNLSAIYLITVLFSIVR